MKKPAPKLQQRFSSRPVAFGLMSLMVLVGVVVISIHAAGIAVSFEAEKGTLSGGAVTGADSNASGSSYLAFGSGTATPTPTPTPAPGNMSSLISAITNVTTAKAYRYTSKDSQGSTMDTLKIIANPSGGYLGVYHTGNIAKLSTSTDMINWTFKVNLDPSATQPTIIATADGGFVTGVEYNAGSGGQVRIRHYASQSALYSASYDHTYTATRTLSSCNEGTPNIYSVKLNPDIAHSVIDIGMHEHDNCGVDRQARATLTNFTTWSASKQPAIDQALIAAAAAVGQTVGGNIGDRDGIVYGGVGLDIHEVQYLKGATGQNGSFASWRPYLYNFSTGTAQLLTVKTHHGSTAFANPTFTLLKAPDGTPSIVTTYFVPTEGAGTNEAGTLIFYAPLQW